MPMMWVAPPPWTDSCSTQNWWRSACLATSCSWLRGQQWKSNWTRWCVIGFRLPAPGQTIDSGGSDFDDLMTSRIHHRLRHLTIRSRCAAISLKPWKSTRKTCSSTCYTVHSIISVFRTMCTVLVQFDLIYGTYMYITIYYVPINHFVRYSPGTSA